MQDKLPKFIDEFLCFPLPNNPRGFLGGSVVKHPPVNAGDVDSTPGREDSPGEGNGNLFSILAWEISWTEKPGRLQSKGSQKS